MDFSNSSDEALSAFYESDKLLLIGAVDSSSSERRRGTMLIGSVKK
jgi:hypothetical protein